MRNKLLFITIAVLLILIIGCPQKEELPKAEKTLRNVETNVIKVTDPVCTMEIDKEKALKAEYEGTMYYFCSAACLEKFEKEPKMYLDNQ